MTITLVQKLLWEELWYVQHRRAKINLEGSRLANISPCFLLLNLPRRVIVGWRM